MTAADDAPGRDGAWVEHFVYSPAGSYPNPYAALIDDRGAVVHTWSSAVGQPAPGTDPPSFLRGWNHVEVAADGGLLATVPLHCLLRLDSSSEVVWTADVAAHHDVDVVDSGDIYVLTEGIRIVEAGDDQVAILDNQVTIIDAGGRTRSVVSLYDVLQSDAVTRSAVAESLRTRQERFLASGWPDVPDAPPSAETVNVARELFASATYEGELRRSLQVLRQLPGSPCDVLHANTVEVLDEHPRGLWGHGAVLLSFRNLDTVVVADLEAGRVLWAWGPGVVSGQHQPSALANGNILVFDNGVATGRSRVIEVDPATRDITWAYEAAPAGAFFVELAGGCELLPNGNVLVTESNAGAGFQVRRDGSIAWRWAIPDPPTASSRTTIYRLGGVPLGTVARVLDS